MRIWSRLGRRPLVAVGNSNGDIADAALRPRPTGGRGCACCSATTTPTASSPTTTGAEDALARATERGWTVVSVKDDWTQVFPDT